MSGAGFDPRIKPGPRSQSTEQVRDLVSVTVKEPVTPFFPKPDRKSATVTPMGHFKAHPAAWEKAKELAGGNVYRLLVEPGGTVLVLNHQRYGR